MAVENPYSTFVSGKKGYVVILDEQLGNSVEYPFGDWAFPIKAEFVKRNNYMSRGFQDGVSGFKSGAPSFKGPWGRGFAPITVGGFYWVFLGITADDDGIFEYQAYVHISAINPTNNAEGAPDWEVQCDTLGEFTIASQ